MGILDDGLTLKTNFSVRYFGKLPFTIVENYHPIMDKSGSAITGYYNKNVDEPGGKYVLLPTILVDVTTSAEDDSVYDTVTMAVCKSVLGVEVTEIQFFSRAKPPAPDTLAAMKAVAKAQGVPVDDKGLKNGTWTSACR